LLSSPLRDGSCYVCATRLDVVHEHRTKVFFGHSAVHPLDHARIGMAHCYTDEVRRHAVQAEPGAEGPAEVVGAHWRDASAFAGLG
jgi:hypothetical protein